MSDNIEQEIQDKGLTGPRVTMQDVEDAIVGEHYFTAAEGCVGAYAANNDRHPAGTVHGPLDAAALPLLTFCVLVLSNGFTVTGEAACVSPENFDAEIGRKIARRKAVEKIWPLLGFQLRTQVAMAEMFGKLAP